MNARTRAAGIATFSALGAFLFGLDIGYIAPIIECASFKRDIVQLPNWQDPAAKIPDATAGFIVGIFSIGCIFSSLPPVSSYFLDTCGRKLSIMMGASIFLLGCASQATAHSLRVLLAGRLISGMSIGLLSSAVALYQSEIAPPSMRGSLTSMYQLMVTFGILVAALVDALLVEGDGGWRLAIWFQALPGFGLLLAMAFLPRSPRWLVQQGRREEALAALSMVREVEDAQQELSDIIDACEEAYSLGDPSWSELFQGRRVKLLLLGVVLQMLQQLVGMNAFMYFGPRIFTSLGHDASKLQTLTNTINFLATFPALFLADRCGRRSLLIWSALGMTLACVGMAALGRLSLHQDLDGTYTARNEVGSCGIIAMVLFFVANFAYGWGPIVWVYTSEMFPLRYRSRCVAVATWSNWVGNYVVAQFTPLLLGRLGFDTFVIFASFGVTALLLATWLPETKGLILERIDEVFDAKLGRQREMKGFSETRHLNEWSSSYKALRAK